jgi:formylglycine-generating enzyme required for sulfatase activity
MGPAHGKGEPKALAGKRAPEVRPDATGVLTPPPVDPLVETVSLGTSSEPRSTVPDAPGPISRWGSLELIEKVGEGGFGETFRARDPQLDREVALKLLKPEASRDEAVSGRVIREGALLARVRHPNVVLVHGAERAEGRVGLWMEFVQGRTLEAVLQADGTRGAREAVAIGVDLCRALSAVHAAGIVHSDIKASNVMLQDGGRVVLMDFGAGWDLERAAYASDSVVGTPVCMAPEVLSGGVPTVRSDIYSLGVLLYRLVSGMYPVSGSAPPSAAAPLRPRAEARAGLPEPFVQVIERCLSLEPGDRYDDASALEAALLASGADLAPYRKDRIAEWSHPRYRLDLEFVDLTLLVDEGEEAAGGRWAARPERYRDLRELLRAIDHPAVVLLGPPGSGKSTLLRRLELDMSRDALAGSAEGDPVTFFIQLNRYRAERTGDPPPPPGEWLAERWRARHPDLPPLPSFWGAGRVILLLDGLNEMPITDAAGSRRAVTLWKEFLERIVLDHPGNRVVFSCRTLDYSAPLSTPSLRVPQVVVEPMTDEQVEQFLGKHGNERIWPALRGTPQLEVMRSPYFLSLLLDQVDAAGGIPMGRAELFTGFVKQALKREAESDNPLFAPGEVLTERDVRRITRGAWSSPWDLPEAGVLIPKLADLAFGMQARNHGGAAQVRVGYDQALEILSDDRAEQIVKAGESLSVLDEDPARDEVKFFHQLLQEYFAGRRFAKNPDPGLLCLPWNAEVIAPSVSEVLERLPAGESLPPLATTGWEETALLASAMARDADAFVRGLMVANLPLAGRCAAQPDVSSRVTHALRNELRHGLVDRSRERAADVRSRIDAGLALGTLGDPRFDRRAGPYGDFLFPPMTDLPGGRYPIGEDEPYEWHADSWSDHTPRHDVEIWPFRIGRFPVTNAEWALFLESGGYEEGRWWDTEDARRWQQGQGTADTLQSNVRQWFEIFHRDPEQVDRRLAEGNFTRETWERWKKRLAMTPRELEAHIQELYPGGIVREPDLWRDPAWNNPSQPVVGICWFEARAYANWLSAQSGVPFRLPTEAEWEAAARGREGRSYACDVYGPLRGNTAGTRVRRTTPVGVFVEGDTPEGVSDLTGNVDEWTMSLYGEVGVKDESSFRYPYRPDDGREDLGAGLNVRRVIRGGSWTRDHVISRSANRMGNRPASRDNSTGFRLAVSSP